MATQYNILAWRIPWTEEPGLLGCSPWGHKELDKTENKTLQRESYKMQSFVMAQCLQGLFILYQQHVLVLNSLLLPNNISSVSWWTCVLFLLRSSHEYCFCEYICTIMAVISWLHNKEWKCSHMITVDHLRNCQSVCQEAAPFCIPTRCV